jgi:hypothetical protein
VGQLLSQFGLNNGCPGAAVVLASVQAPMKLDCIQPSVHHVLDDLPDQLKQTNTAVVAAVLCYQDNNDPAELLGNRACLPDCGNQLHLQVP